MHEKELHVLLLLATSCFQLLLIEEISKKKNEEKFGLRSGCGKETL